jgi:hypothetical protein
VKIDQFSVALFSPVIENNFRWLFLSTPSKIAKTAKNNFGPIFDGYAQATKNITYLFSAATIRSTQNNLIFGGYYPNHQNLLKTLKNSRFPVV